MFNFFKKGNEDRYRRMFYEAGIYESVSKYSTKYVGKNTGIGVEAVKEFAKKNNGFGDDNHLTITKDCFKAIVKALVR